MAVSRRSHALRVDIDKNAGFADSGATEHMTERREWWPVLLHLFTDGCVA